MPRGITTGDLLYRLPTHRTPPRPTRRTQLNLNNKTAHFRVHCTCAGKDDPCSISIGAEGQLDFIVLYAGSQGKHKMCIDTTSLGELIAQLSDMYRRLSLIGGGNDERAF